MTYKNRLLRQLKVAIERGDHAAEVMLRARLRIEAAKRITPITESELRAMWGDR